MIKKCLQNDRRAQSQLYRHCYDPLMRICIRYKHNREDAVSLLNDGFLKILLRLKEFDFERDFEPWTCTIMVRTAIDDFRRQRRYRESVELKEDQNEMANMHLSEEHDSMLDSLKNEALHNMLQQLEPEEKLVFNLHAFEGYKHKEIANQLGVTERSSKRYLHRARQKLKALIEKELKLKKVI